MSKIPSIDKNISVDFANGSQYGNSEEELFSPMKDLIPEETCKKLNEMCRE